MARPRQTPTDILLSVLRRNNELRQRREVVLEQRRPPVHRPNDTFFEHFKNTHFQGNEEMMFQQLCINRGLFEAALNIVADLPLVGWGRRGFVYTIHDKLFFLVVFLPQGIKALRMAYMPKIKSLCQVLKVLHETVNLLHDRIVQNTVAFRNEQCPDDPRCSSVVDCTVVEITGPALPNHEKNGLSFGETQEAVSEERGYRQRPFGDGCAGLGRVSGLCG